MGISRFVQPESVRLYLVDVHKRAHQALLQRTKPKATKEELAESAARVAFAEEQGDWIEVKKRLNTGEWRAALARRYVAGTDGSMKVNLIESGIAQSAAYLLDWSFPEFPIRGKSIDEITAALNALDPDDFAEIKAAVEQHEDAVQAEREEAKKKTLHGANASSATLPSDSSSAAGTSASPN